MKTKISRSLVNKVIKLEFEEPYDAENHKLALTLLDDYCRANGLWFVDYIEMASMAFAGKTNGAKKEDIIKGIELILNCEVVYE